jgi:hypothetical protein
MVLSKNTLNRSGLKNILRINRMYLPSSKNNLLIYSREIRDKTAIDFNPFLWRLSRMPSCQKLQSLYQIKITTLYLGFDGFALIILPPW